MSKKVLAVSGGVDSVVMLDMIYRFNKYSSGDIFLTDKNLDNEASGEFIVAHFNHGIRENANEDAEFVKRLAEKYGFKFVLGEANLGKNASEAEARAARYEFLQELAGVNGEIFVAHHLDDLVETTLINFVRGTGWRGLAGMNRPGIRRPFLGTEMTFEPMDKAAIMEYAAKLGLCFREDQSNSSDEYLRNRIRHHLNNNIDKMAIYQLWKRQKSLGIDIDELVVALIPRAGEAWQRDWFRNLDDGVALELLRAGLLSNGISATRAQTLDFLHAIQTYAPGKCYNLPKDRLIKLSKTSFTLKKS